MLNPYTRNKLISNNKQCCNCFNSNLFSCLLKDFNFKLPLSNNHYVTGKNISTFSSLLSVENNLSNISCKINNFLKHKHY